MDHHHPQLALEEFCRVCLAARTPNVPMTDLFTSVYKSAQQNLCDLFSACTSLELHPNDGWPPWICSDCLARLIAAHEFRVLSHTSRDTMCGWFSRMKHPEAVGSHSLVEDEKTVGLLYISKQADVEERLEIVVETTDEKIGILLDDSNNFNTIDNEDDVPLNQFSTSPESRFPCLICDKSFRTEYLLCRHSAIHEKAINPNHIKQEPITIQDQRPLVSRTFICDVCNETFHNRNEFIRHAKSHFIINPHKNSKGLDNHQKWDRSSKPHVCPYCPKRFQQICSLKDHVRTHTGETPFLCSECGKAFNSRSNMRQHMLRHAGVKPFECGECPMRFIYKGIWLGARTLAIVTLFKMGLSADKRLSQIKSSFLCLSHIQMRCGRIP